MAVPAIIDKVRRMKEENQNERDRLKREREEAGLPRLMSPDRLITRNRGERTPNQMDSKYLKYKQAQNKFAIDGNSSIYNPGASKGHPFASNHSVDETHYTDKNYQPTFKERVKKYWKPTDDSDGDRVREQINKMRSNKSQRSIYDDDDLPVLLPNGALGAKEPPR